MSINWSYDIEKKEGKQYLLDFDEPKKCDWSFSTSTVGYITTSTTSFTTNIFYCA